MTKIVNKIALMGVLVAFSGQSNAMWRSSLVKATRSLNRSSLSLVKRSTAIFSQCNQNISSKVLPSANAENSFGSRFFSHAAIAFVGGSSLLSKSSFAEEVDKKEAKSNGWYESCYNWLFLDPYKEMFGEADPTEVLLQRWQRGELTPDTLKIILDAGADPNVRGPLNYTPLHTIDALEYCESLQDVNNVKMAQLLIDAGADVLAVDDLGCIPFETTRNEKIKELIIAITSDPARRKEMERRMAAVIQIRLDIIKRNFENRR